MKSHSLTSSLILTTAVAAGSLELGKGIINTFSFDIFSKCVSGEYELSSATCQFGPQVSINVLSSVIFLLAGVYLAKKGIGVVSSKVGIAILALAFGLMLSIAWRMQVSLQDNFIISSGPDAITEYLYIGFVWMDTLIIGAILGLFAWLPLATNRSAKERKEPRVKFVTKKKD